MARLGNIPIADKNSDFDCGAAFFLIQKTKIDAVIRPNPNWEVEISAANPYVVIRGKGATDSVTAFELAHEIAQQGLDLFSIKNIAHLSIRDAFTEYLLWWREQDEQILRFISVVPLNVQVNTPTVIIKDQDGNIIPDPPPPPEHYHESLRYFRLSQVTDDLVDAYRNMWLAFELLLSSRFPKQGREVVWLENSLQTIVKTMKLPQIFHPPPSDIVVEIMQKLYHDTRLPLFHATEQRGYVLPHSTQDREAVVLALRSLTSLFIHLAENWLNVRYIGGGITNYHFGQTSKALLENSEIIIADVHAPILPDENLSDPVFANFISMSTHYTPEYARPGIEFILGSIPSNSLSNLSKVARFAAKNSENELILGATVEADLSYEGIDRLEAQLGVRLNNVRVPRFLFNT